LKQEAFVEPASLSVAESAHREHATSPEVNRALLASPNSSGSATCSEAGETLRKTGSVVVPLIEQFEARLESLEKQGARAGAISLEPAAEPPSWWVGKDPVPMELLEDTAEEPLASVSNSDIESLLPPLPNLRPQLISAPLKESPPRQAERAKAAEDVEAPPEESPPRHTEGAKGAEDVEESDPQQPPVLRPRSYRNSLKCSRSMLRESSKHRGSSLVQEVGQMGHLGSSVSSSRPTTAGAETASTYSTSWREEWTPGHKPVEKIAGLGFVLPAPPLGARPPPLPPLPTKPPEQGVVSQPSAGGSQVVASPLGSSTEAYRVDDAALRRICQSNNAKVATPPPLSWRKLGRSKDISDDVASIMESAEGLLSESFLTDEDDRDTSGVQFSELACAFATLEVS